MIYIDFFLTSVNFTTELFTLFISTEFPFARILAKLSACSMIFNLISLSLIITQYLSAYFPSSSNLLNSISIPSFFNVFVSPIPSDKCISNSDGLNLFSSFVHLSFSLYRHVVRLQLLFKIHHLQ